MSIDFSTVKSWNIPEGEVLSASLNGVQVWEKQSPTPTPAIIADVTFIDYDGTILYEYTAAEALALTALPSAPDHSNDGTHLGQCGWNYTFSDFTSQITYCGKAIITPTFENIQAQHGNYGEALIQTKDLTGTVNLDFYTRAVSLPAYCYVDWGDGQYDTISVTKTGGNIRQQISHTYINRGNYSIIISTETDNIGFKAVDAYFPFDASDTNIRDKISGMFFSVDFMGEYTAFSNKDVYYGLSNLEYAFISYGLLLGSGHNTAFGGCAKLKVINCGSNGANSYYLDGSANIMIASNLGSTRYSYQSYEGLCNNSGIKQFYGYFKIFSTYNSFNNCPNLKELILTRNTTVTGNCKLDNSVNNCTALEILKFTTSDQSKITYDTITNSFQNLPTTCKIYVPSAKMADYKALSGMPDPTVYEYIGY